MDVLNCRFAAAVDVCPCDNIKLYETVVCKGGGFFNEAPRTWAEKYIFQTNVRVSSVHQRREYGRFCLKIQFWYKNFEV